jgi:hypothetical protein
MRQLEGASMCSVLKAETLLGYMLYFAHQNGKNSFTMADLKKLRDEIEKAFPDLYVNITRDSILNAILSLSLTLKEGGVFVSNDKAFSGKSQDYLFKQFVFPKINNGTKESLYDLVCKSAS